LVAQRSIGSKTLLVETHRSRVELLPNVHQTAFDRPVYAQGVFLCMSPQCHCHPTFGCSARGPSSQADQTANTAIEQARAALCPKNTSLHEKEKFNKLPYPSSPTVPARYNCAQARSYFVGRYPGWWNNLDRLPKRVFKTLSGCDRSEAQVLVHLPLRGQLRLALL
jgi:hypothetical protein